MLLPRFPFIFVFAIFFKAYCHSSWRHKQHLLDFSATPRPRPTFYRRYLISGDDAIFPSFFTPICCRQMVALRRHSAPLRADGFSADSFSCSQIESAYHWRHARTIFDKSRACFLFRFWWFHYDSAAAWPLTFKACRRKYHTIVHLRHWFLLNFSFSIRRHIARQGHDTYTDGQYFRH